MEDTGRKLDFRDTTPSYIARQEQGSVSRGLSYHGTIENRVTPRCYETAGVIPPFFDARGGMELMEAIAPDGKNDMIFIANAPDWLYIAGHHNNWGTTIHGDEEHNSADKEITIQKLQGKFQNMDLLVASSCYSLQLHTSISPTDPGILFLNTGADIILGYYMPAPISEAGVDIRNSLDCFEIQR
jgi:hypothetical protein